MRSLLIASTLILESMGWPCDFCQDQGIHGERNVIRGMRNGVFANRDRGGPIFFKRNHHTYYDSGLNMDNSSCAPLIILQSHHRLPSEEAKTRVSSGAIQPEKLEAFFNLSCADRTFMINSAYARVHGYGYYYFTPKEPFPRNGFWSIVPAMKYVLKECPSSYLLALDSDVYVRNVADPFDLAMFPTINRTIAITLECDWFTGGKEQECMDMNQHQRIFEDDDWEVGYVGAVNTGVIFVTNPHAAPKFLDEWYDMTNDPRWEDGKKMNLKWPGAQKAIQVMLQWGNKMRRREVMLLDPSKYNGPDGIYVRHLYGAAKHDKKKNAEEQMFTEWGDFDISAVLQDVHRMLQNIPTKNASPRFVQDFWWHTE